MAWKKDEKEITYGALQMREWLQTPAGKAYRKRHNKYIKQWRKKNIDKQHATQKRCYDKARMEVLAHYSKGNPKCACCGEKGIPFLSIDHINGTGAEHRRKIDPKKKMGGNGFVYWLKKNKYPEGFQILCYNCNFAKRTSPECPHKKKHSLKQPIKTKTIC